MIDDEYDYDDEYDDDGNNNEYDDDDRDDNYDDDDGDGEWWINDQHTHRSTYLSFGMVMCLLKPLRWK